MVIGRLAMFVGGAIVGAIGSKFIDSKAGKDICTKGLALGIRGYENLVVQGQYVQSGFDDIWNNAKQINEERKAKAVVEEVEEF